MIWSPTCFNPAAGWWSWHLSRAIFFWGGGCTLRANVGIILMKEITEDESYVWSFGDVQAAIHDGRSSRLNQSHQSSWEYKQENSLDHNASANLARTGAALDSRGRADREELLRLHRPFIGKGFQSVGQGNETWSCSSQWIADSCAIMCLRFVAVGQSWTLSDAIWELCWYKMMQRETWRGSYMVCAIYTFCIFNKCMFGSLIDTVFWTASAMCDLLPYDGYVLHTTVLLMGESRESWILGIVTPVNCWNMYSQFLFTNFPLAGQEIQSLSMIFEGASRQTAPPVAGARPLGKILFSFSSIHTWMFAKVRTWLFHIAPHASTVGSSNHCMNST